MANIYARLTQQSDWQSVQVLSPMHKNPFGVQNLNHLLQQRINPPELNKSEVNTPGNVLPCTRYCCIQQIPLQHDIVPWNHQQNNRRILAPLRFMYAHRVCKLQFINFIRCISYILTISTLRIMTERENVIRCWRNDCRSREIFFKDVINLGKGDA